MSIRYDTIEQTQNIDGGRGSAAVWIDAEDKI